MWGCRAFKKIHAQEDKDNDDGVRLFPHSCVCGVQACHVAEKYGTVRGSSSRGYLAGTGCHRDQARALRGCDIRVCRYLSAHVRVVTRVVTLACRFSSIGFMGCWSRPWIPVELVGVAVRVPGSKQQF